MRRITSSMLRRPAVAPRASPSTIARSAVTTKLSTAGKLIERPAKGYRLLELSRQWRRSGGIM